MAGSGISQATRAEPLAKSGETCVSPQVWALISECANGAPIQAEGDGCDGDRDDSFVLVSDVQPNAVEKELPLLPTLASLQLAQSLLPFMRRYVPFTVAPKLLEGVTRDVDLSEMRQVSVMFINFEGVDLSAQGNDCTAAMESGQAIMCHAQEEVHHMEGQVNKILVDDKGTVLLCVFGLPPRPVSYTHLTLPTKA